MGLHLPPRSTIMGMARCSAHPKTIIYKTVQTKKLGKHVNLPDNYDFGNFRYRIRYLETVPVGCLTCMDWQFLTHNRPNQEPQHPARAWLNEVVVRLIPWWAPFLIPQYVMPINKLDPAVSGWNPPPGNSTQQHWVNILPSWQHELPTFHPSIHYLDCQGRLELCNW